MADKHLGDRIPNFGKSRDGVDHSVGLTNWSALTSGPRRAHRLGGIGHRPRRGHDRRRRGTAPARLRSASLRHAAAQRDRDGARDRFPFHLAPPARYPGRAAGRLRHRRLDGPAAGGRDHAIPLRREDRRALHPDAGDHADAGAGAAADLALRLRLRAADHRRGSGVRAHGDDQLGHRVPPRRSRQDRAGPLLRRQYLADLPEDPRCRWRCR